MSCYRSLDIDQGNSGFFSGPRAKVRAPQAAGCCRMLQDAAGCCKTAREPTSLALSIYVNTCTGTCILLHNKTVFEYVWVQYLKLYIYIHKHGIVYERIYRIYIYILYTYIDTILYNCVRVYIYLIYIHIYYIHIYLYQIIHIWYTRYAQAVQGDMHRHTVHHN